MLARAERIKIVNMTGGSIQFGNLVNASPKSASKTIAGSGAANIGAFIKTDTFVNVTNIFDIDGIDQPITNNI